MNGAWEDRHTPGGQAHYWEDGDTLLGGQAHYWEDGDTLLGG